MVSWLGCNHSFNSILLAWENFCFPSDSLYSPVEFRLPPDLSVVYMMLVRGAESMEKRPRRSLFVRVFCSHVLSGLSPYSVDNLSAVMREPPPLAAAPATERSERVGEEAQCICSYSEQVRPEALISGCVCCFPWDDLSTYPEVRSSKQIHE